MTQEQNKSKTIYSPEYHKKYRESHREYFKGAELPLEETKAAIAAILRVRMERIVTA
mgnify:FL=1